MSHKTNQYALIEQSNILLAVWFVATLIEQSGIAKTKNDEFLKGNSE